MRKDELFLFSHHFPTCVFLPSVILEKRKQEKQIKLFRSETLNKSKNSSSVLNRKILNS